MKTALQTESALGDLKAALQNERAKVIDLLHQIDRALDDTVLAERISIVRHIQGNQDWLEQLRCQYSDQVKQRTLKLNNMFPSENK